MSTTCKQPHVVFDVSGTRDSVVHQRESGEEWSADQWHGTHTHTHTHRTCPRLLLLSERLYSVILSNFCRCRGDRSPSCRRSRAAWCSWRTPSSPSTSRRRTCSGCRRTWTRRCRAWTTSSATITWPKTRTGSSGRGETSALSSCPRVLSPDVTNWPLSLLQTDGPAGRVPGLYREDPESCGILPGQQPRQSGAQHSGTVTCFMVSIKLWC